MTQEQEAMLEDALALPWSVVVKKSDYPDDLGEHFYYAKTPELNVTCTAETAEKAREGLVACREIMLRMRINSGEPIPSPKGG